MKKQINRNRKKVRVHPACRATCARDVDIPLPLLDHSDGGPVLFVVADVYTSSGKRVVDISSGTYY